jgi:hypothetical protein
MDYTVKTKWFDGHVQTIVTMESDKPDVEFIFGDGRGLLSVCTKVIEYEIMYYSPMP